MVICAFNAIQSARLVYKHVKSAQAVLLTLTLMLLIRHANVSQVLTETMLIHQLASHVLEAAENVEEIFHLRHVQNVLQTLFMMHFLGLVIVTVDFTLIL